MKSNFTVNCFLMLFLATTFTTSIAQLPWTKHPDNPVLRPGASGSWEEFAVYAPFVLKDGDTFKMWYSASKNHDIDQSGYATSADGINWTKHAGNPVLKVGTAGSWDAASVVHPYILKIDSTYHMWYGGTSNTSYTAFNGGYATSTDGISWEKYKENPVIKLGSAGNWDSGTMAGHSFYYDGETFHMWYGASAKEDYSNGRIGYATSTDGIIWEKYEGNPVFNGSGSWDKVSVWSPRVIVDESGYKMWYSGWDGGSYDRIGYATSSDGITWKSSDDFVLDVGSPGEWDDASVGVQSAHVIVNDNTYNMWYTGMRTNGSDQIGYATAPVNINVPDDYATIQGAINAASDGNIVLVDEGTYYENINFKGKAITVASRFYMDGDTSHISNTIIDGSQPTNPDSGTVVYLISGEDTTSVLCGFTITGGSGTYYPDFNNGDAYGAGGILMFSGGKIIHNKIINQNLNYANNVMGGGVQVYPYNISANIIIEQNNISYNTIVGTRLSGGSGIQLVLRWWNGGYCRVKNNIISYNSVTVTGTYKAVASGIMLSSPLPTLGDITIANNIVSQNELHCVASVGAGIYVVYFDPGYVIIDENPSPLIYNNIVTNNYSEDLGGGLAVWTVEYGHQSGSVISPQPVFINNTVVNNSAADGCGLFNFDSYPLLLNNILWNDLSKPGSNEIFDKNINFPPYVPPYHDPYNNGDVFAYYSDIQGGWEGETNMDAYPTFVDTANGVYNLTESSKCVGTGIDSLFIQDYWYYCPSLDHNGNDRPNSIDKYVDMGAIESPYQKDPTGISSGIDIYPNRFKLNQNYPNPFNPNTKINYQLSMTNEVNLIIYNVVGQKIATLVSEKQGVGHHQVEWDASGFASGIYYYRIEAGEFQNVKKMVLLK